MSLRANKLTDLTPALQAHIISILSNLSGKPRRSTSINLESQYVLEEPLPEDLLAVAKTSPALAAVVADVLGVRAQVLTNSNAHPLHEWVPVLAPFVKAVSWNDYNVGRAMYYRIHGSPHYPQHIIGIMGREGGYGIKLLEALSAKAVHLRVLDLKELLYKWVMQEKNLFQTLVGALKQNGESLREVGLRVNATNVKAVKKVCLPNLQIAELLLVGDDSAEANSEDEYAYSKSKNTQDSKESSSVVMKMLKALEGHAERSSKQTTLSELRLLNVVRAPCTVHVESCAGLFKSVRILKLTASKDCIQDADAVAKFITLFRNVVCLHWKGSVEPRHIHLIHDACQSLEEIHLNCSYCFPELADVPVNPAQLFLACRGKLRSLSIDSSLTIAQIRVLGETNPELQDLQLFLKRGTVSALPLLLGTHCRKIQSLDMRICRGSAYCLDENDWRTLAETVKSASEKLCEISIGNDNPFSAKSSEVEGMERCVREILEFLGERARKVSFKLSTAGGYGKTVIDLLMRLMRSIGDQTRYLESLHLSVTTEDEDNGYEDDEEERRAVKNLSAEKQRMISALPRLERCDVRKAW